MNYHLKGKGDFIAWRRYALYRVPSSLDYAKRSGQVQTPIGLGAAGFALITNDLNDLFGPNDIVSGSDVDSTLDNMMFVFERF